ncbi:MAG: hypothetical protein LBS49_04245 [Candidatus Accumulibacter sp.]|nr:hypothetical protein [Accumulibacter sp.]
MNCSRHKADYENDFRAEKLLYPEISQGPKFAIDSIAYYPINKLFYIATTDWYLVGLMNSKLIWSYLFGICSPLRGGEWRLELRAQHVETVPIPDATDAQKKTLALLAQSAQRAAEQRRDLIRVFSRRILTDLAPGGASAKLPTKLAAWPGLDFKTFHEAVKKHFRQAIPLAERDDWQTLFEKNRKRVEELDAAIAQCERQIDEAVYKLFDLTPEQIELIEESAG